MPGAARGCQGVQGLPGGGRGWQWALQCPSRLRVLPWAQPQCPWDALGVCGTPAQPLGAHRVPHTGCSCHQGHSGHCGDIPHCPTLPSPAGYRLQTICHICSAPRAPKSAKFPLGADPLSAERAELVPGPCQPLRQTSVGTSALAGHCPCCVTPSQAWDTIEEHHTVLLRAAGFHRPWRVLWALPLQEEL